MSSTITSASAPVAPTIKDSYEGYKVGKKENPTTKETEFFIDTSDYKFFYLNSTINAANAGLAKDVAALKTFNTQQADAAKKAQEAKEAQEKADAEAKTKAEEEAKANEESIFYTIAAAPFRAVAWVFGQIGAFFSNIFSICFGKSEEKADEAAQKVDAKKEEPKAEANKAAGAPAQQ